MRKRLLMMASILCGCFWMISVYAQPSSFSLRNSHVTMPQGHNDFSLKNSGVVGSANFGQYIDLGGGNWFKGSTSNGRPSRGTLHLSNGVEHKGAFDINLRPTGVVLTTWPDGDWYYGNYKNGVREGYGSWCLEGEYYDVIMSDNEIESSICVETPRYNKADYDKMVKAANNAAGSTYSESSTSSSSTRSQRSSSSSSMCNICVGSGKCNTCNGKGSYIAIGIGSGWHRCTNCNQTGKCPSCKGTGKRQ